MVASVLLVGVLLVACWTDLRSRRIPNWLTVGGMLAGLAVRASMGPGPVGTGILGIALAALLALPFFAMGALGGGDAKLLMAVGAASIGPSDSGAAGKKRRNIDPFPGELSTRICPPSNCSSGARSLAARRSATAGPSSPLAVYACTAGCTFWTCDLTPEYVRLNADYHT